MSDIKVTIMGQCNTGKSTVAELFKQLLEAYSINVAVTDSDFIDNIPTSNVSLCRRLYALSDKGLKVEIETVQANKTPIDKT